MYNYIYIGKLGSRIENLKLENPLKAYFPGKILEINRKILGFFYSSLKVLNIENPDLRP